MMSWMISEIVKSNFPPIARLADADRPHGRRLCRHPRSAKYIEKPVDVEAKVARTTSATHLALITSASAT